MNTKKKKVKYILTTLLLSAILTSCASSNSQGGATKTNDATESKEEIMPTVTPTSTSTDIPTPTPAETSTPVPLPTIVETEPIKDNTYIIPDSNSRILSVDEVNALDANTKQMAINEIYARHGRTFDTLEIQEYFNAKAWYSGTVAPENFDENVFNKYEKCNISSLSGQTGALENTSSAGPIYFAGSYFRQYSDSPLKYIELCISVASDPGLSNSTVGDCVANVDYYNTEYFLDGVNYETDYDSGTIYMEGLNVYAIYFASGYSCTMTVDENGITISGGGLDGYYLLTERYHS